MGAKLAKLLTETRTYNHQWSDEVDAIFAKHGPQDSDRMSLEQSAQLIQELAEYMVQQLQMLQLTWQVMQMATSSITISAENEVKRVEDNIDDDDQKYSKNELRTQLDMLLLGTSSIKRSTGKKRRPPRGARASIEEGGVVEVLDGGPIRKFVEDAQEFEKAMKAKFKEIDVESTGSLTRSQMVPVIMELAELLGVPAPKDMGEAQVTFETIFDNIDKDQSGVIEEPEFVEMGREVFMALAESLSKTPVTISTVEIVKADGKQMQDLLSDKDLLQALLRSKFQILNEELSGSVMPKDALAALQGYGDTFGLPPKRDLAELEHFFVTHETRPRELEFPDYVKLITATLTSLAERLQASPLTYKQKVAERKIVVLNGQHVQDFLDDKGQFEKLVESLQPPGKLNKAQWMDCIALLPTRLHLPEIPDMARFHMQLEDVAVKVFNDEDHKCTGAMEVAVFPEALKSVLVRLGDWLTACPIVCTEKQVLDDGVAKSIQFDDVAAPQRQKVINGSEIKAFVVDEDLCGTVMKAKFKEFDKQGSGLVKKETVAEVVFHIVQILGIPPPETSQGTRTLYTDIADQLEPEAGRLLTVEEFCTTCVGAFNSIADSLAKNPLTISQIKVVMADGKDIRELLRNQKYLDGMLYERFTVLSGKSTGLARKEAIAHVKDLGREFGLPPSDSLESFFDFDEFDTDHSGVIEFPEFRVLMRTLLDVAATKLEKHPVTYTQTFVSRQVVVSDGSIIQDLLDSPETFNTFCKNVFNSMEKKSLVLDDILMCVRMVRSQLGLPPPSKMKQHVTLIEDLFKAADVDHSGTIEENEFPYIMRATLTKLAAYLKTNPIVYDEAVALDDIKGGTTDATEAVVEIDGSHITEFLKDDANFRKYMQTKFAELDVHGSGTLTKKDMRPIVEEIVQLLGLPAFDGDTDTTQGLYETVYSTIDKDHSGLIDFEEFLVMGRNLFETLAESLQKNPMKIKEVEVVVADGSQIRNLLADTAYLESLLKLRFNELKQSHINGLNKDELRAGLEKFGGEFHLPTDDPQLFSDFFTAIDEDGSGRIEYKEYRALMVDLLQLVAAKLEANPLTSHQKVGIRKVVVCDGSEVLQLLEDKEHFAEVAKAMFEQFEKASVTKDQIFESVQNMRNELRLPPPKDMAKHHTVLEKVFAAADQDGSGTIEAEEFPTFLRNTLAELAQALQDNPWIYEEVIPLGPQPHGADIPFVNENAEEIIIDGSSIREFMANEEEFRKAMRDKFDEVDEHKKGTLTKTEMIPIVTEILTLLGIQPENDKDAQENMETIFKEVDANGSGDVDFEEFYTLTRCVFQEMADRLQESPMRVSEVDVVVADGSQIRALLAQDEVLDSMLKERFLDLNQSKTGGLTKPEAAQALKGFGEAFGLPPADDLQAFEEIFQVVDVDGSGAIEFGEFKTLMTVLLTVMAETLEAKPIIYKQTVGVRKAVVSDGAKIRSFLADTESFELAAKTYFDALESEHLTKDVVKDCIKCMRQELGLPPAQEMVKFDERFDEIFDACDGDKNSTLEMPEFLVWLRVVLEGMADIFDSNPIVYDEISLLNTGA